MVRNRDLRKDEDIGTSATHFYQRMTPCFVVTILSTCKTILHILPSEDEEKRYRDKGLPPFDSLVQEKEEARGVSAGCHLR